MGTLTDLNHFRLITNEKRFISDIGAQHLKPLFITGSCITTVSLDLSILSERWFHSQKSIVEKKSRLNKIFAVLSIGAAVVGTLGLVLLSILDVVHYKTIHQTLLIVAMSVYPPECHKIANLLSVSAT